MKNKNFAQKMRESAYKINNEKYNANHAIAEEYFNTHIKESISTHANNGYYDIIYILPKKYEDISDAIIDVIRENGFDVFILHYGHDSLYISWKNS